MESEIRGADLSPIVKEVSPATRIIYALLPDERGYGMSAAAVGEGASSVRIDLFSADLGTARRILLLLADNLVFPFNVHEILDDLLAVDPFV